MSHLRRVALALFLAGATASPGQITPEPARAVSAPLRTAEELEQLLGPIALYPDALIALILPASTAPADIVLAARHLRAGGDLAQVESRAWENSVKSLTRYPDVLRWLDDNLDWTKQLGEAFLQQSVEVMNTIQRLRERARAAGTLLDTPQQQIITTPGIVRIVPVQPDRIYVPVYDPSVTFLDRTSYGLAPVAFGPGYPVGSWLAYDCDWAQRKVWVGDRHRPWRPHDWRRPVVTPDPSQPKSRVTAWQAPVRPAHPASAWTGTSSATLVQPNSFTVSPPVPTLPAPRNTGGRVRNYPGAVPDLDSRVPPSGNVARREYPGPRSSATKTPPPVDSSPSSTGRAAWVGSRSRSLPNTVGTLPTLPSTPTLTAPSLPTARSPFTPSVVPSLPSLPGNTAPSLPNAAPPLPQAVPTFVDPPAASIAPGNPPPDRAPRIRGPGRNQLD
jgi:hypothetical protein